MVKVFWSSRATKGMDKERKEAVDATLRLLAIALDYNVVYVGTTMRGRALQITMYRSSYTGGGRG